MNRIFIPVMVMTDKKMEVAYMDVSNLGLSELLELKEKLKGTIDRSIAAIDSVLYNNHLSDKAYTSLANNYNRTRIRKKERHNSSSNKFNWR